MKYEKKLLIAKILVSLGLCLYALLPYTAQFGPIRFTANQVGFYNWLLYGNLIALPIMLWAIWSSRLHGTGRSVRLMGFLGLAFTLGFYMASRSSPHIAKAEDVARHNFMIEGLNNNVLYAGSIFLLLLSGIILSIRRKIS